VRAKAGGQFAHSFDGLVAALADDVRRTELVPERNPLLIAAQQDDLFGAETLRGDDAAQADCAIADDSDGLAGRDMRRYRGVMAGAHDVGEREQRRE
jgi:hypothetical protein